MVELVLVLAGIAATPGMLMGQLACPPAPLHQAPIDSGRIVIVGRLTEATFDRWRNQGPDERPYISGNLSSLVYEPVAELRGHRNDANRDFYGALPENGGPDWTVGRLYLLVLQPQPAYERYVKRAVYWTAACFGSQEVESVEAARRLVGVELPG